MQTVIFDFFGVIAEEQAPEGKQKIERTLGIEPETLWERYWRHRRAYDLNQIDGRGFWSAVAEAPLGREAARQLVDIDVASWSRIDESVVEVVHSVAAHGSTIALLSNLPMDLLLWHQENTPVLREFHAIRASCLTGLAKPDDAAFTTTLDAVRASARDTVLVDDHEPNVAAGQRLGMEAILYRKGMRLGNALLAQAA